MNLLRFRIRSALFASTLLLVGCNTEVAERDPWDFYGLNAPQQLTTAQMHQLHARTTFGYSPTSTAELNENNYKDWLEAQMALPATQYLQNYQMAVADLPFDSNPDVDDEQPIYQCGAVRISASNAREGAWWESTLYGEDQFRQRVAFALGQILVISRKNGFHGLNPQTVAAYYDILSKHAFGNYRDLLKEVTLSPGMGNFLSMVNSRKENPKWGVYPDENYAREIMQLFSIGLYQLNLDGSQKLDANGKAIASYSQADVETLARAFTGWTYSDRMVNSEGKPINGSGYVQPMIANAAQHDMEEKILFAGTPQETTLPAGQSAEQDLEMVLDALFNHPNIAPFIAKQLIQRLVTANPSPAYVERVAQTFNQNSQGVRGDLKSTLMAILLDPEALNPNATRQAKLLEPTMMVAKFFRGIGTVNTLGPTLDTNEIFYGIQHGPLFAETVFNYYANDFMPTGALMEAGLVSPESQIFQWTGFISYYNLIRTRINRALAVDLEGQEACNYSLNLDLKPFLDALGQKGDDLPTLVELVNQRLFHGTMSDELREILQSPPDDYHYGGDDQFHWDLRKKRNLLHVLPTAAISHEFLVQE